MREFKKEDIIINGNSTHTVVPYRGIDSTQTIILIDNGSNGTIDDSVLVVNVTSVRDYQSLQQEIRLYPNPAGQLLTLSYPPYMPAGARLHIADLTGRLLYNAPLDASKDHAQISLTQFIPGVYMLRITDVQGSTVFAEKFVKQ